MAEAEAFSLSDLQVGDIWTRPEYAGFTQEEMDAAGRHEVSPERMIHIEKTVHTLCDWFIEVAPAGRA